MDIRKLGANTAKTIGAIPDGFLKNSDDTDFEKETWMSSILANVYDNNVQDCIRWSKQAIIDIFCDPSQFIEFEVDAICQLDPNSLPNFSDGKLLLEHGKNVN